MQYYPSFLIISSALKDILAAISLFNNGDYFAAHDFFEELWVEADKIDRLFFQGLIQVSVGSYHLINGNRKGSLSQFKKGTRKLKNYLPDYLNVDVQTLLLELKPIIEKLNSSSEINDLKMLSNLIPTIKQTDKFSK